MCVFPLSPGYVGKLDDEGLGLLLAVTEAETDRLLERVLRELEVPVLVDEERRLLLFDDIGGSI